MKKGEERKHQERSYCRVEQRKASKSCKAGERLEKREGVIRKDAKEGEQITFNLTADSAGDWREVEPADCFCHWNSLFS